MATEELNSTTDENHFGGEAPSKRAKRGKYATRACAHCQKKKVRCVGGTPCDNCIIHDRDCVAGARVPDPPVRGRVEDCNGLPTPNFGATFEDSATVEEVLRRLSTVEQQIESALSGQRRSRNPESVGNWSATQTASDRGSPEPDLTEDERQTFVGEASGIHALRWTEEKMRNDSPMTVSDESHRQPQMCGSESATSVLHGSKPTVVQLLSQLRMTLDKRKTDTWMRCFFDEVHILYPFLHQSRVRQCYESMMQNSSNASLRRWTQTLDERLNLAVVFLCLATGRCTMTTREGEGGEQHSAGWSFYRTASALMEEILNINSGRSVPSLCEVQALLLMIVYLFRLDAHQRAERILSQAIVNAHMIGLHRQSAIERMPAYTEEMASRTLWCLFILERRICLYTGRPFAMHEMNIDARQPWRLSEEWLNQHQNITSTMRAVREDAMADLQLPRESPISYLNAMISYSQIVGKAWKARFESSKLTQDSPPLLGDYVDLLIEQVKYTLPPYLTYDPEADLDEQWAELSWWQIKQSVSLSMRCLILKLLVLQPRDVSLRSDSAEALRNASKSVALATQIVKLFVAIPDRYPKFCFPLPYYIINAMMTMLSNVGRYPTLKEQCSQYLDQSSHILQSYCGRNWVSEKGLRVISRLQRLRKAVLADEPRGNSTNDDRMLSGTKRRREHTQVSSYPNMAEVSGPNLWLPGPIMAPSLTTHPQGDRSNTVASLVSPEAPFFSSGALSLDGGRTPLDASCVGDLSLYESFSDIYDQSGWGMTAYGFTREADQTMDAIQASLGGGSMRGRAYHDPAGHPVDNFDLMPL